MKVGSLGLLLLVSNESKSRKLLNKFIIGFFLFPIAILNAQLDNLRITILSTMVADYDYLGEWGFSALIETENHKILFDTGFRENTVMENADSLKIDLSTVEHVFLSHNHLDHTGGLKSLREKYMRINPNALKYVHVAKGIFEDRWSKGENMNSFKGLKEALERLGIEFIYHEEPEEIFSDIWTTGIVPRIHNERNWSGYREMLIEGKSTEDNIPEDQSLVIRTKKGLVLVSGCGHAGIVNTLNYCRELFDNALDVFSAIGGFHLFNKNEEDIKWTAKFIRKSGVKYFLGAHCTGVDAVFSIRKYNKMTRSNCAVAAVGSYYDFHKGMFPGIITK